ncbi:MAG: RdgB/HAM1 family non-canonical purine NTP pyrophosphatase [Bacteroidota bacterium]|nr:RdgB/HAM1 family non-canonical purine NTP pyrophosphatase [Bacteroidota bacterium]
MNILFASSNKNKIKEVAALIPAHIKLLGLSDIHFAQDIAETAPTIEGNAKLKAEFIWNYISEHPSEVKIDAVFADDSGLEVEALNWAPGVYSARYAGEPKNDEANNKKLFEELKLQTKRNAQFKTVIAFIKPNIYKEFEGIMKGTIAYESRGKNGFGYDPLFIPQGYRSTFAELDFETKNSISHRGVAVKQMVEYLSN